MAELASFTLLSYENTFITFMVQSLQSKTYFCTNESDRKRKKMKIKKHKNLKILRKILSF